MTYVLIAGVVLFVVLVINAINILREYERGVVFTLRRYAGSKGPGLIVVWPIVQQMVRVILGLDHIPQPDDAADALAVAICHIHSRQVAQRLGAGEIPR